MSDTEPQEVSENVIKAQINTYLPGYYDHELRARTREQLDENLPQLSRDNLTLICIAVASVALIGYFFYWSIVQPFERGRHAMLFFGGCILIVFLDDFAAESELDGRAKLGYDIIGLALGIGGFLACIYFFFSFDSLMIRVLHYYWYEYVMAGVIILAVLEGTRRVFGMLLTVLAIIAIAYAYAGQHIPGALGNHPGYSIERIIETSALTLQGIFGNIVMIGATWVAIFIVFAGIIQAYGGLDFIQDIGLSFASRFKSGAAQVAIISSMLMGSVTGSSAANTAATGSFTIPLMKRSNIEEDTAAAIESIASTGGQVLPPVMGAASFLMAELTGIPYSDIIIIGIIPALLFYGITSITATVITIRGGVDQPVISFTFAELRRILWNGLYIVAAFLILIYFLVFLRYNVLLSGVYAILTLAGGAYVIGIVSTLRSRDHSIAQTFVTITKESLFGMMNGARKTAPILIIFGPIVIIIEMITLTALNQTISMFMVEFGTNLIALLILGALMSILFGLGLPTVAAYILVAIFVVPGLIEFGVSEIYAHFFVFYFAVLSGVTPPIALAIIVATNIADADFLSVCFKAIPFVLAGCLIPFSFIYNPSLLMWDSTTPFVFAATLVGMLAIMLSMLGYNTSVDYSWPARLLLFVLGFGTIFAPVAGAQLLCLVLTAGFLVYSFPQIRAFVAPQFVTNFMDERQKN